MQIHESYEIKYKLMMTQTLGISLSVILEKLCEYIYTFALVNFILYSLNFDGRDLSVIT